MSLASTIPERNADIVIAVDSTGIKVTNRGYDSKRNFNILYEKNIEAGILPKKNASTRSYGSPSRAKCVRELGDEGYNKWKEDTGYGKRWIAESIFSAVKRISGEYVRATSMKGMWREVKMKFIFYNMLLNMP